MCRSLRVFVYWTWYFCWIIALQLVVTSRGETWRSSHDASTWSSHVADITPCALKFYLGCLFSVRLSKALDYVYRSLVPKFKGDILHRDVCLKPKMLFPLTIFLKRILLSRVNKQLCNNTHRNLDVCSLRHTCTLILTCMHMRTHSYTYSETCQRHFLKSEVYSLNLS